LLRTAGLTLAATIVVTAIFDVIPMTRYWSAPGDRRILAVSLLPQALTVFIPIGLAIGVALGLARRRVSARLAAAVAAAAAVISIASVANVGWILPNANQAFRVAMFERLAHQRGREDGLPVKLERGETELTFGELSDRTRKYGASPFESWEGWRARTLRLHYQTRWSLAFASLALTLFSLPLATSTHRLWVIGVGAVGAIIGYYIILYVARSLALAGSIPAYLAAWAPNVTFALATAILTLRKLRVGVDDELAR
jgi:lipopolysaccharide export LptBFGC system permease protein LptF